MERKIKLGIAPTRRNMFIREEAIKYKSLILDKMREWNLDFVDLEWLNEEGLLYDVSFVDEVEKRFQEEKVDALFIPHCNFGSEEAVCKLAKRLGKPVLLWGPRDDAPLKDGLRQRDSQCGLFATSKVLSKMGVPFTYIENCWIDDPAFEKGVKRFLQTASVVKAFRNMKIGQIDTRPGAFWSVMCNESELLEKFNIEIVPLTLVDLQTGIGRQMADHFEEVQSTALKIKKDFIYDFSDKDMEKMAALKLVLKDWIDKKGISAIAIQCWDAMQDILGVMPCFVNSLLTEEGFPVVCETDINGAISAVLTQAALNYSKPIFFADLTIRHPENDNAELLWHCGPFPASLRREGSEAKLGIHYTLESKCPGVCEWELKKGELSICRFDGINGEYSLTAAKGKCIDGPRSRGTYAWVEFSNWVKLEKKLVYGPYIHHVAGIYGDIIPALEEAIRYMPGVKNDIFTE